MPLLRFVVIVFVVQLLAATTSSAAETIPLSFGRDRAIIVQVAVTGVDGSGTYRFIVDTGATLSAVSSDLARRLGARGLARAPVVSASGTAALPVVSLERVAVGSQSRDRLTAIVLPANAARLLSADGVLGQNFLGSLNYTIDYRHKLLRWDADPPPGSQHVARLTICPTEGRWLVELPQNQAGGQTVRLVPDSAANALVIFDRGVGRLPLPVRAAKYDTLLTTITGRTSVRRATVTHLQVGDTMIRDEPAVIVDRTEPNAPDGDGLLPLSRFESVSFNTAEGYLIVRK